MMMTQAYAMDTFKEILDVSREMVQMFLDKANTDERVRIANTMALLHSCSDILYEDLNRFRIEFGDTNWDLILKQIKGKDAELLVAKLLNLLEYGDDFDGYVKHVHGNKGDKEESNALASAGAAESQKEEQVQE